MTAGCYLGAVPLGDFFATEPALLCPLCGTPIPEWEGFGGPGVFMVFSQGEAAPRESRLPSQVPEGEVRLSDGRIPLFATCKEQHLLMAEAIVEGGVFAEAELRDADGGVPLPLVGGFVLWRSRGARFAVSSLAPTAKEGVVPASITAIGYNDGCILATRRRDTRDPTCDDEWFVVDVAKGEVFGPVPDPELKETLAERGLEEPDVMSLPEDVEP